MTNGAKNLDVTAIGEREIRMTRSFAAPRRHVFDALTKPELVRRWLGPRSWEMVECEIDLRVGGCWRYVMRGPDTATMVMVGVYREIDAPELIVTTESFDDNWTGGETVNTYVLTEVGARTTLVITVTYASGEARDAVLTSGMEAGAAEGFERLDDVLSDMEVADHE